MEWKVSRIARLLGECMFGRRTLLNLVTKLAIGLGALFLVGVLLAAIPNHRPPAVTGPSAGIAQGADHSSAQFKKMDEAKTQQQDAAQATKHRQATAPRAANSTQHD
jgi:hypothetical protein